MDSQLVVYRGSVRAHVSEIYFILKWAATGRVSHKLGCSIMGGGWGGGGATKQYQHSGQDQIYSERLKTFAKIELERAR